MGPSNSCPVQADDALAHLRGPGHAADQRIVQAAALEGRGMRNLAQLQQLQQHGSLRQIGDDDSGFGRRDAFHLDVQVRRPLALEFLARQGQSFVGGLDVAQRGAGQNHAEKSGHDRGDDRDVAHQRAERNAVRVDQLHVHRDEWLLRTRFEIGCRSGSE